MATAEALRNGPEAQARKLASAIYPKVFRPFARSLYNRDNLFEGVLQERIIGGQPIPIVGFWGVGGKSSLGSSDISLLDHYQAIHQTVETVYPPGVSITIILADAHGRFNGYNGFEPYLEQVAHEAVHRGFNPQSLDALYQNWNLPLPNPNIPIDQESGEWQEFRSSRRYDQLVESAGKHSQAEVNPEQAAYAYWQMRRREGQPLSRTFPKSILLANGSEDLGRATLPLNMPHLYSRVGPVWFLHD